MADGLEEKAAALKKKAGKKAEKKAAKLKAAAEAKAAEVEAKVEEVPHPLQDHMVSLPMLTECSLHVPRIHTHSPTFLPVLSTSPIDYYDGGTVRLNTEFYSWDTSFGPVNPRLRYSCLQVVCCVNLGTFYKCFLQLGWGLTSVRPNSY